MIKWKKKMYWNNQEPIAMCDLLVAVNVQIKKILNSYL